ncbi:hypothetical protein CLAIMM_03452 [Cladophialophora immunda]|nr:hypothetical protein CLAIMM_03452 [Cladophialophora immunda]
MAFSTNPSDKLPLTFGVEIEYVFGVNKDVVCSNPVYHWLFPQNCSLYPNSANPANFDPTLDAHKGLLQAVKILRSKGARLGVIVHQGSQEESFDLYSQWHMSTDSSVRFPANAYDLERFSRGRIREWRGWEFSGLELISPALPVPEFDLHHFHPYGLAEVQTYLGFMTQPRPEGTPYFFLSGPEAAGKTKGTTGEKRTVEFRQHHGTLAIKDIAHWVVFLTALARTAERKANEEPRPNPTLPPSLAPKILSASLGHCITS